MNHLLLASHLLASLIEVGILLLTAVTAAVLGVIEVAKTPRTPEAAKLRIKRIWGFFIAAGCGFVASAILALVRLIELR